MASKRANIRWHDLFKRCGIPKLKQKNPAYMVRLILAEVFLSDYEDLTQEDCERLYGAIKHDVMSGVIVDTEYLKHAVSEVVGIKAKDYVSVDADIAFNRSTKFYQSQIWKNIRFKVLSKNGGSCELCGATSSDGAVLSVDHIKPRSIYPELARSLSNLQVLCMTCNSGKGNMFVSDFRQ